MIERPKWTVLWYSLNQSDPIVIVLTLLPLLCYCCCCCCCYHFPSNKRIGGRGTVVAPIASVCSFVCVDRMNEKIFKWIDVTKCFVRIHFVLLILHVFTIPISNGISVWWHRIWCVGIMSSDKWTVDMLNANASFSSAPKRNSSQTKMNIKKSIHQT